MPRREGVRGNTAGSCKEVPAAVSDMPRQAGVRRNSTGSCEEVPAAVLDMPRQEGVRGNVAESCEGVSDVGCSWGRRSRAVTATALEGAEQ
ncbi:hypothetical protein L3X38_033154 [Prunus dulcis]|uniref:Uncharacterized protein n=1 Tax=Prunus dulcis TaxID=3755 RepID=A0AAD4YWJ9_PRUDU|nr:hypothetical protein L3X38_033154 [Prunus dulcis]